MLTLLAVAPPLGRRPPSPVSQVGPVVVRRVTLEPPRADPGRGDAHVVTQKAMEPGDVKTMCQMALGFIAFLLVSGMAAEMVLGKDGIMELAEGFGLGDVRAMARARGEL